MATFCKPQHLAAVLLVSFVLITTFSSMSSARLLNDFLSNDLPAAETALDLALVDVVSDKSEQESKPCDHMVPMKRPHGVGILRSPTQQRLTGKYGAMILSKLPKGAPVPPSAPSKGINNLNN